MFYRRETLAIGLNRGWIGLRVQPLKVPSHPTQNKRQERAGIRAATALGGDSKDRGSLPSVPVLLPRHFSLGKDNSEQILGVIRGPATQPSPPRGCPHPHEATVVESGALGFLLSPLNHCKPCRMRASPAGIILVLFPWLWLERRPAGLLQFYQR